MKRRLRRVAYRCAAMFSILMLGAALAAFAPLHRPASLAGTWRWSLQAACVVSRQNPMACDELLAMGLHVYNLKATRLTYRGTDRLTLDAGGRFKESGAATFSGTSPGGTKLHECNPAVMARAPFRRTCHVTWSGRGHVAEGGTFLSDFFTDTGRLTYRNKLITYFQDYHDIGDSLIPAVAGTYTTHRYLSLVGYARFIPGVTINLKVSHT